ncbi:hypothetical protein [Butyricimonas sp. Marseille-P3923]|uniref:hypothetical protein n=1 Tax=Butyricimonas sp. Marseille-P3923 TaxID=1987504 RepID=UPI000C08D1DA|nr:hypothetical protein [Butyricimonas sp. Marseille-P3923]
MTHDEKLDKILYGLLSRISTKIRNNGEDDKRLTMDFICKTLFKEEGHEDWETEFLQRGLLSDGLIEFKRKEDLDLPEITDLGIKYIQNGGYTRKHSNKKIEEDLKIQTLKNAKKSWIAIVISVISLILTAINIWVAYIKN